jgi:hypothetical protein
MFLYFSKPKAMILLVIFIKQEIKKILRGCHIVILHCTRILREEMFHTFPRSIKTHNFRNLKEVVFVCLPTHKLGWPPLIIPTKFGENRSPCTKVHLGRNTHGERFVSLHFMCFCNPQESHMNQLCSSLLSSVSMSTSVLENGKRSL